jgi:hypothetical protein
MRVRLGGILVIFLWQLEALPSIVFFSGASSIYTVRGMIRQAIQRFRTPDLAQIGLP